MPDEIVKVAAHYTDLELFLEGRPGSAKVQFQVNWIYPRLLVGNIQRSLPAMSITHTYYDCSGAGKENGLLVRQRTGVARCRADGSVNVQSKHFTKVYFYPIYSPSEISVDVEMYNSKGERLGIWQDLLQLDSPGATFATIDIETVCRQLCVDRAQPLTARVLAHPIKDSRFPARIKLGLDLGHDHNRLPCNICTNLHPFNPSLENKPHCFRWSPIFPNGTVWLINSSPPETTREMPLSN